MKKLVATSGLRLSGVLLQTLVLVLVGRVAGPAGVGALQVFLAWTSALGEGAAGGLPTLALRKLATFKRETVVFGLFCCWRFVESSYFGCVW